MATHFRCKCCPLPLNETQLKKIFWQFDKDGDRLLSRQELAKAFDLIGSRLPGWRAYHALFVADENGDGYISERELEEVIKYLVKIGYKIK